MRSTWSMELLSYKDLLCTCSVQRLETALHEAEKWYKSITRDVQQSWEEIETHQLTGSCRIIVYQKSTAENELVFKVLYERWTRGDRTWTLNSWRALFETNRLASLCE